MDSDGLKIIKYKGTNNFFIALCKIKEEYYIFVSKTKLSDIKIQNDTLYTDNFYLSSFKKTYSGSINIDMLANEKDNSLFNLFKLDNEKEFDTISEILECYL